MNGLRFKVGDLVIVVASDADMLPSGIGSIGEIKGFGVCDIEGNFFDYEVLLFDNDWHIGFFDRELSMLQHPAEPVSLTRSEEVSV